MAKASREFQVFVKPGGALCNLDCDYCYYLKKDSLIPKEGPRRMPDPLLEQYIIQHIEASPGKAIHFSWHGGEPTLLGVDYFRRIVELQRRHRPSGSRITNGMQTNGILLDEDWCRFLASSGFAVGLSLDGPEELHDRFRRDKGRGPTHRRVMQGYEMLRRYKVPFDILCVVHADNVRHPLEVYRFFKEIEAPYLGFLPLVERQPEAQRDVSERSVPAEAFGDFLCTIFDEWLHQDIGRTKVQIFEEAAATAFGREHELCIFRETCGDIPVIEHNGDFYCCDHFVDPEHRLGNIMETPLSSLLESKEQHFFGQAKKAALPACCLSCEVRMQCHGGCPKDRFLVTPQGEGRLNYLCAGYKSFFNHCRPFVAQLAALWRQESPAQEAAPAPVRKDRTGVKGGRNDPCPCGSGKKYKKCCLGR